MARTAIRPLFLALALGSACGGESPAGPDAGTGTLVVTAATTGQDLDPDGYGVTVDGGAVVAVPSDGQVVVGDLPAGDHSVQLSGLAPNCAISGDNPRTSTVTPGGRTRIAFDIECGAATGEVEVTVTTSGAALDPDGYQLQVDGAGAWTIGVQGAVSLTDLATGEHSVELVGLAPNCQVQGENPRRVTTAPEPAATLSFEILCLSPARDGILFHSDRNSVLPRYHLFRMRPDGAEVVDLTPTSDGQEGDWSPDGQRIAFTSYRDGNGEIYVMNSDGTGLTRLTHEAADDNDPIWSPDGRRIAFVSTRGGGSNLYLMNTDGTSVASLTRDAGGFQPSWSPDGTRIAFARVVRVCRWFDVCIADIFVIPAAGGSATNLTRNAEGTAYEPAWSPDGSRIAYSQDRQIWTIGADGAGKVQLTGGSGFVQDLAPVWSPDGGKLLVRRSLQDTEVFVINADGSGATNLSNHPANEEATSWR
jgi:hypothetical protein